MRQIPRLACKAISPLFSIKNLIKTEHPVFFPFYHVVSNKLLPHISNYPVFDEERFENELDFFLKYFNPVSLEEIYNNTKKGKNIFHLSFDDGLRECVDVIMPILLRKGIPATFFINSGFVGNKKLFHRYKASLIFKKMLVCPDVQVEKYLNGNNISKNNILQTPYSKRKILNEAAELYEIDFQTYLEGQKPYLDLQQIKTLHQNGFTIGGHSHKHPEFWKLSEKKQLKHVKKSMDWLAGNINPKIKAFAFPYTDDGVSANFIRKLKIDNICDISFGTAGVKYDEINSHFQRYPAEQKGNFATNLKSEFIYFKLRKLIGKAIVRH